jgi:hypothetical protein
VIANGAAYVVMCLTSLVLPEYASIPGKYLFPTLFGELWLALWLAIKGIRFLREPGDRWRWKDK